MRKVNVTKVEIVRECDNDPDTGYLGAYTSKPGPDNRTIDREERGDMLRGEYRYFVAGEETRNPDSVEQDYQRMEGLSRGEWCYLGIYARVEVIVNGTVQTIRSPGLWGIESDSSSAYFDEVAQDELDTLKGILSEMGIGTAIKLEDAELVQS